MNPMMNTVISTTVAFGSVFHSYSVGMMWISISDNIRKASSNS